MIQLYFSIHST